MVYLDSAANTLVDNEVLDSYVWATKKFIANPNSSHAIGLDAKKIIDQCSSNISSYFKCSKDGIIYTSGSSEANNLVIKGVASKYKDRGKHIIISALEHSSVVAPCNYLSNLGYDVSVISINKDGIVDLEQLKKEINDNTILVSICSVDSEVGTIQPIKEISEIVKKYPNCIFHTDATQAIGKTEIDYSGVDFITFAPHKFFGLNGFGCLVNRNNVKITPLIHGGKSTTIYRSGTPVTASIVALDKAFFLAISKLNERQKHVKKLNDVLREGLKKYSCVHINSPKNSIYNTLNFSLIGISNKDVVRMLEEKEIYVSTTTACSLDSMPSKSVLALTNDLELSKNTIRISMSHLTTLEDIYLFLKEFDKIIMVLNK
ncbi:MAG: cysteine desulfurase [Bacilli bacterium]|nr:cysteine desulfurase [Bacilli bacterium]